MPDTQTAGWARPYRCRVAHWFDPAQGTERTVLLLPVCGAFVYVSRTEALAGAAPEFCCQWCLRKVGHAA